MSVSEDELPLSKRCAICGRPRIPGVNALLSGRKRPCEPCVRWAIGLLGVERKWIFHWDGEDHEPRIWRYRPDLRRASPERVRLAEWQRNRAARWRDLRLPD